MARQLQLVVFAWACAHPPPGSKDDPTDTDTDTDTDTPTTADTATTVDTTATGDTGQPPNIDCAALPSAPLSVTSLEGARGYHDVAFDATGHLIGSDGNSLLQVTYDGEVGLFLPGTGTVQGMDWLPNGDLVYADAVGSLIRVTPEHQPSVLASGGGTVYGVTVGPDGQVYAADWTSVARHDPATGARARILHDARVAPYVLDFSPDHRRMYVGTIWNGGTIWVVDLDADLNPVGEATPFATVGSGELQLHDALAVDWCGNVYVAEYYTNDLYRISPAGEVTVLYDYTEESYGHGLEWGSGIGGWRADALYVPQPYNDNRVMEIVIGVPSREWTGTTWPPE